MRTLNLGILAHVDAGKTTLTERLLFVSGVIDQLGSVDDGNTQTDSLPLERQRGITIKSAVVSFEVNGVVINLIDTPGHPDFIAEVERVLTVLDGAVLVVSAVEGVQAQTRVLMRTLQRLCVPSLIFINKIDRSGAQEGPILQSISDRLTPGIIAMGSPYGLGTHDPGFTPYDPAEPGFTSRLTSQLADHDDALLAAYVGDEKVPYDQLRHSLVTQIRAAQVHPVYFGSAVTGAGVEALIEGVTEFLPTVEGDAEGPVAGSVFKVERGPSGEKIAYVRLFSGTVRIRDRLHFGDNAEGKVTAIHLFDHGKAVHHGTVTAGHIAKLTGLVDIQIGDAIGTPRTTAGHYFAPPSLETVVVPSNPADKGALHSALTQLAEQDPLINLRQDDVRQEIYVSLYGEVQKEVIQATLASEYAIDVTFRETTPICVERPAGVGTSLDVLGKGGNPYVATVGLRVEPAPAGAGIEFRPDVTIDGIPIHAFKDVEAFRRTVETAVRNALRQGIHGWQVTDCIVTMTKSGFVSATSAKDFRLLTPLVLMDALSRAGTIVCEPIHRFHLDVPADTVGQMLAALARLRAVPETPAIRGSECTIEGVIPAGRVHLLQEQLSGLTRGEGVLESALHHFEPVSGKAPSRPHTGVNPLNRTEYLRQMKRGI
ncbi:translation factor GTPase family protein [Actinopolymorpha sp. B17G11]|uniref:translation factor GTPase family protein n=1 Tax=Actinopolymorpha sp. B17G11 TaxID=3160861 RepID=UPI0032E3BB0D